MTVTDQQPPSIGEVNFPGGWIAPKNIPPSGLTLTAIVSDTFSGLDFTRGQVIVTSGNITHAHSIRFAAGTTPWQSSMISAAISIPISAPTTSAIYTMTLEIYDQAGNRAMADRTIRIDPSPPTMIFDLVPPHTGDWHTQPTTVTLHTHDDISGLKMVTYTVESSVDGFEVVSDSSSNDSALIVIDKEGTYTLTAWAIDQAGNRSNAVQQMVSLDLTAPMVFLNQSPVDLQTIRVSWLGVDNGAGIANIEVQLRRGDREWEDAPWERTQPASSADVMIDPEQPMSIRARAQDKVGRWGEWVEMDLWLATDWIYLPVINR